MSHTPLGSASVTLPAVSNATNSTATPSRRASSRAKSPDTPRASPVAGSFWASTGLPKLIATRSLPVGARSLTTLEGAFSAMASMRKDKTRASAANTVMTKFLGSVPMRSP